MGREVHVYSVSMSHCENERVGIWLVLQIAINRIVWFGVELNAITLNQMQQHPVAGSCHRV